MTERPPAVEAIDITPIIHRVLIPPDEVIYVYGFCAESPVLRGVPMMWLERDRSKLELVAILPERCVVERWTRDEPAHKDWTVVWSPPGRIDVSWLHEHPDWSTA